MDHQDWKPVVLTRTLTEKEQKAKFGSTTLERPKTAGASNKTKLDNETEVFHHKFTPKEKRVEIVQLRNANKLTQKALAQKCNLQPTEIAMIESGNAIYDPRKTDMILRVLRRMKPAT